MESFLVFVKSLKEMKQKRILFMIEAYQNLSENFIYDTNFGTYPDYQNIGFDKQIRTEFYLHYTRFAFSIQKDLFSIPNDESKIYWENLKISLLKNLGLDKTIFDYEYKTFTIGLKLKGLRNISKKDFSKISGLSQRKIDLIEEYCFMAKLNDVRIYVERGLGINFSLILKE
ncbi:hypothetical protein ASG01_00680 [Chryseobacterium sp. Leaf180]|nr:hypothetical protein ASG01_00680 [Chryseobacterium sp. Leaf180]